MGVGVDECGTAIYVPHSQPRLFIFRSKENLILILRHDTDTQTLTHKRTTLPSALYSLSPPAMVMVSLSSYKLKTPKFPNTNTVHRSQEPMTTERQG